MSQPQTEKQEPVLGNEIQILIESEDDQNKRIDRFLSETDHFSSRSQAEKLIQEQKVLINGKPIKASYKISIGDKVSIHDWPREKSLTLSPHHRPLEVVFEDEHVIVVNKPSDLVVHPATSHEDDTLVNILIGKNIALAEGADPFRPGIVHRLDKDTSGLLVIAKTSVAYDSLVAQFKARTTHRVYWAIVFGQPTKEQFTVESLLARHERHRKKYASTENSEIGKNAISHFESLAYKSGLSLLRVRLQTGRTHQIRVHISESGYPIVGDELYGAKNRSKNLKSVKLRNIIRRMQRFSLHAAELGFTHPVSNEKLLFYADWPENLKDIVNYCLFDEPHIKLRSCEVGNSEVRAYEK